MPDQFIKLNVGPIIILGGAPANSVGLNAYENSFTAASVGAFASGFGADVQSGIPFPQAVERNKSKLVKSNVAISNLSKPNLLKSVIKVYLDKSYCLMSISTKVGTPISLLIK